MDAQDRSMPSLPKIPPYYQVFLLPLAVSVFYVFDLIWNGVFLRELVGRERFLAYYHIGVPAVWLLLLACPGKKRLNAEFVIQFHNFKSFFLETISPERRLVAPIAFFATLLVLEASIFANAQDSRGVVLQAGRLPLDLFDPAFVTLLFHAISRIASLELAGIFIHLPAIVALWLLSFWVVRGAQPWLAPALLILLLANPDVLLFFRSLAVEFPAAVAGTVGLVLVARRAPHVGLAFLAFACLLRTSGLMFMIAGLILIAVMMVRGTFRFRDINYVYVALLGFAGLYEYVNVYFHLYNSLGKFVVSSLDPNAGPLGPLELVTNLWRLAPVFTVVALAGGLYGAARRDRMTIKLWTLILFVIAMRFLTFAEIHLYYSFFYIPFALLIGVAGFNQLAIDLERYRSSAARLPAVVLLIVSVIPISGTLNSWWMDPFNRWRGDAPRLVRDLATLLPEGAEILERRTNLILYAKTLYGQEISRTLMPNNRKAALRFVDERVASSPCVAVIITRKYLGEHLRIGRDELAARGFVDVAGVFGVPPYRFPNHWILALPACSPAPPSPPVTNT